MQCLGLRIYSDQTQLRCSGGYYSCVDEMQREHTGEFTMAGLRSSARMEYWDRSIASTGYAKSIIGGIRMLNVARDELAEVRQWYLRNVRYI